MQADPTKFIVGDMVNLMKQQKQKESNQPHLTLPQTIPEPTHSKPSHNFLHPLLDERGRDQCM